MTFTISGKEATRVFKVTSKTQIIKGPGIAAMKDIVVNEEVSGSSSPLVSPTPSTSPKPWANPPSLLSRRREGLRQSVYIRDGVTLHPVVAAAMMDERSRELWAREG